MDKPPRKIDEPLLTSRHWAAIGGWSCLMAACVLGALSFASFVLDLETVTAVTISFLTLGFAKLWFVFNLREPGTRFWDNDIVRNGWIWASIALCAGLLVAAGEAPLLSPLLKARSPGMVGWLWILGMSLIPFLVGQTLSVFRKPEEKGVSAMPDEG
jgi:Ca2+-transporting ATPase